MRDNDFRFLVPSTFAVLAIIALLAMVLVAQLLHLGRSAPVQENLETELSNAGKYEDVVAGLCKEDDAAFPDDGSGLSPERRQKLRRKALSAFLRDIWRDFHRAWSVCKLLAPLSDDPEFAALLVRQRASFYLIYALVRLRLASGSQRNFSEDLQALGNTVGGLRTSAQHLVQATPLPQSAGVPGS